MEETIKNIKKLSIVLVISPVLAIAIANSLSVRTRAAGEGQDPAAVYKESKCVVCHGLKAEKKFDPAKPDDQLLEAVMKGKKAEKPPNMPSYEAKGMGADQARALIAYMKSLRQ